MDKKTKIVILLASLIFLVLVSTVSIKIISNSISILNEVSLEIGTKEIKLKDFYRKGMVKENTRFVTNIDSIDLNKVADHYITINENGVVKTVVLHLVDTTPPNVEVQNITKSLSYEIKPEDFIVSVDDLSATTSSISNIPTLNEYKDYQIEIIVKDESGNATKKTCTLTTTILAPTYTLELGNKLKKSDILYDETINIPDSEIDRINNSPVGNYEITITKDNKTYTSKITIQDTTAPTLKLKNITIYTGEKVSGKASFIEEVKDASGEVTTTMPTTLNFDKVGSQEVIIEATDKNGNTTKKTATLTIKKDNDAPVFSGLSEITVSKNKNINYEKGVSAVDKKDGKVSFDVDSSKVDTSTYGTYYAIYTAKDAAGNVATKKRKILVEHDNADLKELVREYASKAGSDYKSIRSYVQTTIKYSDSWGGSDPVWYGLTKFSGNCYVHALTYKAFLDNKGYENKLIWTKDKTHYWNLIKINGVWRHSDSTPGTKHTMIIAATDEERYAHLQGRDWDRSAWPEAN